MCGNGTLPRAFENSGVFDVAQDQDGSPDRLAIQVQALGRDRTGVAAVPDGGQGQDRLRGSGLPGLGTSAFPLTPIAGTVDGATFFRGYHRASTAGKFSEQPGHERPYFCSNDLI